MEEMNDNDGHNYFFAVPKTWRENKMALLDRATAERLDRIEERLDDIERILEILLEWQEEHNDAIHDEAA